ncbi:MAG: xanthine dehydrogenase family protein molybdopterin-binding subunit [Fimbriimonadaceae bacterium]|nr:xanthine dehydrogenase family protein molybdopterin-binding subunit [Alphaproteobacteria bacterium]
MTETGIGAPVRRKEDQRFITGNGHYTDDINVKNQTYAKFVLSPHAHAKINKVDTSAAMAAPGVVAVFTGADIAEAGIGGLICGWMIHNKDGSPMSAGPHPALAAEKVRYVGDHVAVVIAESLAEATAAAELVDVDYDVLDANVDPAKAQESGVPQIHEEAANNKVYTWSIGEEDAVSAAFDGAAHVTSLDIINNRLIPNAMEPRAAIGEYDAGTGVYTLHTTSQNPHVVRLIMAAFLGIAPENKLRVIAPDVGGGFGSKIFVYAEETVCIWASAKVGRPIKWTAARADSFLNDAHGRDHVTKAELALDVDGNMLALRAHTTANMGAYLSTFASSVPTYLYATLLSGQYALPAIYAEVSSVFTNTAPVDAYRGAGRPEACYVVERLVETAAREMGMDPAELRRKNFVKEFPHATPVIMTYDTGDFGASLDKALEMADYSGFAARRTASEKAGKLRGIGFSNYIEACGIAPSAAVGSLGAGVGLWESAEVRVNPTGSVEVLTGSHSHGQGHETTFAQFTAARLGIPMEQVEIVHGDTDKVQFGMGTYGSRSGAVGMSAITKAIDKVIAKATKIAAHLMEASTEDVDFKEGNFSVKGTDKSLPFGQVALAAYVAHSMPEDTEPGLKEGAFYDPANFTFPAGCHICEVEVDPETGVTQIVNWVAVDDFGTVINPMIVEGQVHGGIAQGIGQALTEGCIYDTESGQLLTGSYMDYCMPRADNLPSFIVGFTETVCPSNPIGVKGCGEAGAIAAPAAVMNAITDATGIRDIAMPATSQRVWQALQTARQAAE